MKANWKLKSTAAAGAIAVLLTGCFNTSGDGSMGGMDHSKMDMGEKPAAQDQQSAGTATNTTAGTAARTVTEKTAVLTGKEITLTAKASSQELAPGKTVPVWTFNNSVPGPQIRVKQGDTVTIHLKNELPEPTSIHWHGLPVPNPMDGIPGVTQNAVQPGKSFTYTFKADVPGTYWYHSHQDSVNQLDRGLYGSIIVEARDESKADRDYTLVLDEWISSGTTMPDRNMSGNTPADNSGMAGMDHSKMNMGGSGSHSTESGTKESPSMDMDHDMSMYDLFTINGKSGPLVEKLPVKQGEKVRIRLVNAGYLSHQIHLHGHDFQITATDGQPINQPGILRDHVISVAPGERYDIEFEANNPDSG